MRGRKKSTIKKIIDGIGDMNEGTKRGILIVLLFVFGGLCLLSVFGMAGKLGGWISVWLISALGDAKMMLPLVLLLLSYLMLYPDKYEVKKVNYFGMALLFLSFVGLTHFVKETYYNYFLEKLMSPQNGGGYIGFILIEYPSRLMGRVATVLILVALFITGTLLAFNTSLWKIKENASILWWPFRKIKSLIGWWRWRRDTDTNQRELEHESTRMGADGFGDGMVGEGGEEKEGIDEGEENENKSQQDLMDTMIIKKSYRSKKVDIPIELLDANGGKPTSGDIKENKERICKTLENFGIDVEMGEVNVGPTVTQYTFRPSEGIKVSQITTLHNDLALALAAHPIRIEAPIPGRALVGIEVPNQKVAIVRLREILQSEGFRRRQSDLMLSLGKDVSGKAWLADLTRMPHVLIAGSTGSGKTICINSIICGLLFQNGPEKLKFIMIDPKRVELPVYNGIEHLITPVITDVKKTVNVLRWAILEMERRFEVLAQARKRDIESYNQEVEEKMSYIVIVIDELADLMAAAGAEVEAAVIRLAQMSRAVGIHLILATQRPSVNVITGLIKANIPARIAFTVASLVDSRTILDNAGAEKLLGRGDMLFMSAEVSKPKRLQGAFISDKEIKRIVRFLKDQIDGVVEYSEDIVESQHKVSGMVGGSSDDDDELLDEAKEVIINANRASTSLLQRRLKIGYARAARIIDILEEQGLVGPAEGSKPREVINQ